MPRPLRIEFENAWYHVSNRGASSRSIFLKPEHTQLFISILEDCISAFDIEVHAFSFLADSYHLLIKTPKPNLSHAMRQLNGMYTQRFNKEQQLDGPLFRGRYRATILEEQYALPICRFVDLQPVIHHYVEQPLHYKWSSYRAHIGKPSMTTWLRTDTIKSLCHDYQQFVNQGIDPETQAFYHKKKQPAILGSFQFKQALTKPGVQRKIIQTPSLLGPSMDIIINATATYFDVPVEQIKLSRRGQINIPRSTAIYLSRKLGRHILTEIAAVYSDISHAAVGTTVKRFQELLEKDSSLKQSVECIMQTLKNPASFTENRAVMA
jgi:REP element-mobilizing transposase RayT